MNDKAVSSFFWRDIPFASGSAAHPATGHHYICGEDTDRQFAIFFYPAGQTADDPEPLIIIDRLDNREANRWDTVAYVQPFKLGPVDGHRDQEGAGDGTAE